MALSGLQICVSGKLPSFSQAEAVSFITKNGGASPSGVTKKTTHLLTSAEQVGTGGAKISQATTNGIPIVSEDWIQACVKAGKPVPEGPYLLVGGKRKAAPEPAAAASSKKKAKTVEPEPAPAPKAEVVLRKGRLGEAKAKAAASEASAPEAEAAPEAKPAPAKAEPEVKLRKGRLGAAKAAAEKAEPEAAVTEAAPAPAAAAAAASGGTTLRKGRLGAAKAAKESAADKEEAPAAGEAETKVEPAVVPAASAPANAAEAPAAALETGATESASGETGADLPPVQNIEVCFSFDTTGSMYPCLAQVRKKISESVDRLFKEIPNIRIAIIAHGDYCDANSSYVIKSLDFSQDQKKIVKWVEEVGATFGGDAPECYELVLRDSQRLSWTAGFAKALVLIGDDLPHEPNDNPEHIDWRVECKNLAAQGVRVYGIEALARGRSSFFYRSIADLTGGVHLTLEQFAYINDLFLAICYREHSSNHLSNYEKEVAAQGRMNMSVQRMFDRMHNRNRGTPAAPSEAGLNAVPRGRFQVLDVDSDGSIRDFVSANGLNFKPGRGFYEFTKAETVQGNKEIVLQDRSSGDFYEGEYARKLLGLKPGETAKINTHGKDMDKYAVFIQSTSYNRKLIGGTKFLYEVEDW